jgi:hypothetical protein
MVIHKSLLQFKKCVLQETQMINGTMHMQLWERQTPYDCIIVNILHEFLGHQPTSNMTRALENRHVHKSPPHVSSVAVLPSSSSSSPLTNGKDITTLQSET